EASCTLRSGPISGTVQVLQLEFNTRAAFQNGWSRTRQYPVAKRVKRFQFTRREASSVGGLRNGVHGKFWFFGPATESQKSCRYGTILAHLLPRDTVASPGSQKLVQHQFASYQTGHGSRAVASPARDNSRALTSLMDRGFASCSHEC